MTHFVHDCVKYTRIWAFCDPYINVSIKLSSSEPKINENYKARKCVGLQTNLPLTNLLTIYKSFMKCQLNYADVTHRFQIDLNQNKNRKIAIERAINDSFREKFYQSLGLDEIYITLSKMMNQATAHCMESARIWSFSGPYFPAFGLNTEGYGESLRIQSECGKIKFRKTPNTNTFHAVAPISFFVNQVNN